MLSSCEQKNRLRLERQFKHLNLFLWSSVLIWNSSKMYCISMDSDTATVKRANEEKKMPLSLRISYSEACSHHIFALDDKIINEIGHTRNDSTHRFDLCFLSMFFVVVVAHLQFYSRPFGMNKFIDCPFFPFHTSVYFILSSFFFAFEFVIHEFSLPKNRNS